MPATCLSVRPLLAAGVILATLTRVGHPDEARSTAGLMEGKVKTGRSIELAVVVEGSPERIFELWSTPQGTRDFFGSDANIEPRQGGLYEIRFGLRPDGQTAGPRGTRILRFEPGVALDFEWEMPQFAAELNARPLPTWVEVRFERLSADPPRTLVRVGHRGFGNGVSWDRSYVFFQRSWFDILFRLKLHCAFFELARRPASGLIRSGT